MNIAIIKDNLCVNIALFDSLSTAQSFQTAGIFDADSVAELPDGYGIGDTYDGETWIKAPEPELESDLEPTPPPEPTPEERLDTLETTTDDIILMMAELIGGK